MSTRYIFHPFDHLLDVNRTEAVYLLEVEMASDLNAVVTLCCWTSVFAEVVFV